MTLDRRTSRKANRKRSEPSKPVRNRKKRNYKLLFKIFLLTALAVGTVSYVICSPDYMVRQIIVLGTKLSDAEKVRELSSPALERSIVILNKSQIVSRVRRLREVADVEVWRSYPNSVSVRVIEKKPVGIVWDKKSYGYVDANGDIFHSANGPVESLPLLVVDGLTLDGAKPSGKAAMRLEFALDALAIADAQGIAVAKISVDNCGDMCLNMDSDFRVKLGQPELLAKKMSVLRRALNFRPSLRKEAQYLDISIPDNPVWMPRTS